MEKLNGKVAVVTGGSAGIGFATAKELVAQGAKVIITGRNQDSLDKAIAELGNNAHSFRADASSVQDTVALVDFVKSLYSTIDILLVNAGGVTELQPIGTIQEETFDIVTNLNFKGAVFTTEKFVPILADGASVIHMSSVAAFAFNQGNAVYASSKAALIAYSKVAAMELADRKIRVNVIAPAMTETSAIHKGAFESSELHDFIKEKFMPFKRYGTPEEVAKLVSFLASDDASFISGSVITIDSGASINSVKL
ncbi:SDR family NAD(P)-dependent oxidoreductase [Rhizosphaericola mali]|uniref:SDR family oxidoreductase n=1 Tax=Rhizosphaericola mali TaxID=2545455 RepID=A0A5P2G2L4_9BACT|nr:SDR family oxidoreductase [Rhizosphaericola mali]QES89437.1 SDR family oxidoreductase [Rhizosphaericola mali]